MMFKSGSSLLRASLCVVVLKAASLVVAAPRLLIARQSITTLSSTQVSSFKPYTFFASTAYCQPSTTLTWSCGANCNANPTFKPVASGGDGSGTQFCRSQRKLRQCSCFTVALQGSLDMIQL